MTNPLPIRIAPSLLAADPLNFQKEISDVEKAGADIHHVDVMDGHFVPNLTYGIPFVQALKKAAKLPLDVHIMVSNPDTVALDYVAAGADYLVFHVEAATHAHRLAQAIRAAGAKSGIAVNPGTNLESLRPLLEVVDLINVMSVNPGFGGQQYITNSAERVGKVYEMLKEKNLHEKVIIQVDGGMNVNTGAEVAAAGASMIVAGNYVFKASNRAMAIADLKKAAEKARKGKS
jgi:ribulose-phosphate 3-epimerase